MKKLSYALYLLLFSQFTAPLYAQIPKGDRTFAWVIDKAENDDFMLAFEYTQAACIEASKVSLTWSEIEPELGSFDAEKLDILSTADYFFPLFSLKIELQIAVTNTVIKTVPTALMDVNYSDSIFIARYKTLLDSVFNRLPNTEIAVLNIGNESDILFGTDPTVYADYKIFLDEVVPYAKASYFDLYGKELKVGTTLTLYGLIDPIQGPLCATLNDELDIVSLTYYPLEPDFTMKLPGEIESHFDALVAVYNDPSQPIYFVECGYATSPVCNSSEILQAHFFSEVFRLWDKYYDNIKYLTIFKSTDWSVDAVEFYGDYYGIDDPVFLEYLRTLGVRTWDGDGTNKLAYEFILCELEARDWCATSCNLTEIEQTKNDVEFAIAPNPFTDQITIQSDQALASVHLYNMTGEMVYESFTGSNQIDTSELPAGIYLVEVQTTSQVTWHQKIVKTIH